MAGSIAWEFDNWNSGGSAIRTPYDIPNQRIQFHPSASPLRQGSYRGLAATANHYAREMHMDAVARALGIDAVEFRLNHLKDERMRAVLQAAAEQMGGPQLEAAGMERHPRAGRAVAGHRLRHRKGELRGNRGASLGTSTGFKVDKLVVVFECGAVVNPDGLRIRSKARLCRVSAGRCSRRSSSVTARSSMEPWSTIACRDSRTCRRSRRHPGSKGPAVSGSGRDAHRLRRTGDRQRGASVRACRDGDAGPTSLRRREIPIPSLIPNPSS